MLISIIFSKNFGKARLFVVRRFFVQHYNNFHVQNRIDNFIKPQTTMKLEYPQARRDETAVDDYHGTKIPDPYKWLEIPESEETKAFVDAQNAITEPFLNNCTKRQDIYNRLKELWNYPKYSCPARHGDKYYFYKNSGLQNQSVLYVQDTLHSEPKVFLDPNLLSEDGTIAITDSKFSEDGEIFAYALSQSGSDWTNINFINAKTGIKYPEVLKKVKFSSIAWTHDNVGIFYSHFPDTDDSADGSETEIAKNQKVMYHRIGTEQSQDILVAEFPENPLWYIEATVSDCGRWLLLLLQLECSNNLVYFAKLPKGEDIKEKFTFTKVVKVLENDYEYVTNCGSKAIFKTNKDAPNYKLVGIDLENFKEGDHWTELVPEHPDNKLDWACAVDKDKIVLCYIENVKNTLAVHNLETGKLIRPIPLEVGTIIGFSGDKKYSEIFYKITSFLTPGIIYTMDFKSKDDSAQVFLETKISNFDASLYKSYQVFYESKDGTKIPMFIVHKKDTLLDGSAPAFLYGYGGFNVSLQPSFNVTKITFVQHFNGILAIPNIRGGGEYGKKWHLAGCIFKKQNSLDDFIAAGEYLIKNNYTSANKLIINGASNGGFLVGACTNQRPDLFGTVIVQVGVLDMLKYHKFTIGYAWASDYGSADDPEQFKNLLKISPLHNIRPPKNGGQYPAMLLLTADHDDRVVPLHSLKMIATLQHEIGRLPQQKNPLLIKVDVKSGHGRGKPTLKVIQECTDVLNFISQTLNLDFQL